MQFIAKPVNFSKETEEGERGYEKGEEVNGKRGRGRRKNRKGGKE